MRRQEFKPCSPIVIIPGPRKRKPLAWEEEGAEDGDSEDEISLGSRKKLRSQAAPSRAVSQMTYTIGLTEMDELGEFSYSSEDRRPPRSDGGFDSRRRKHRGLVLNSLQGRAAETRVNARISARGDALCSEDELAGEY